MTGNFNELVIVFGFPDKLHNYPTLTNNSVYPQLGAFPDGTLLSTYINNHGGVIPIDEWYQPAFSDYFTRQSGGLYNVNFNFPKNNGQPYLTTKSFANYILDNGGRSSDVVFNRSEEIMTDILRNIYAINPSIFSGINAIHLVPLGITQEEFFNGHGGFADPSTYVIKTSDGTKTIYSGPMDYQIDAHSIPHERLHVIGAISGYPNNFKGFPDRGWDRDVDGVHYNLLWNYDMMYHNCAIPEEHSLYGYPPLLSNDLIYLGWIEKREILILAASSYTNGMLADYKLSDINTKLDSEKIKQGYRRVIVVTLTCDPVNGVPTEYFLIEYHKASGYDKNYANYDEYASGGYNKGVLIWHIKKINSFISMGTDDLIDLEVAVPYNGSYGQPIPNDGYPRDLSSRPTGYNGQKAGDFDYLDDDMRDRKYGTGMPPDGDYVLRYAPDGGRTLWDTTSYPTIYNWWPTDPNQPRSTLFPRLSSKRSDFFSDEAINGHVTNKITMGTKPSTKSWDGSLIAAPVAITDIRRENDYVKLNVYFNCWDGVASQDTYWNDKIIIGGDFIIPEGKTLTVGDAANLTFLPNSKLTINGNLVVYSDFTIPSGGTLSVGAGANLQFYNNSSLVINGSLTVKGNSSKKAVFDFMEPATSRPVNAIWGNAGSHIHMEYANVSNSGIGVITEEAEVYIDHCNFNIMQRGLDLTGNTYSCIVQNSYFSNMSYEAIWLKSCSAILDNNNIFNCNDEGVRVLYSCDPILRSNTIKGCYRGLSVAQDCSSELNLHNLIKDNTNRNHYLSENAAVYTCYNSQVYAANGENNLQNYKDNGYYTIFADYNSQVWGAGNYWGDSTPDTSMFMVGYNSYLDYSNWLTSDNGAGSTLPNLYKEYQQSDLQLANSEMIKGKYDDAEEQYKKLIKDKFSSNESIHALSSLASCYRKSKKDGFKKYLVEEVQPKLKDTKSDLNLLYQKLYSYCMEQEGNYDEVLKTLNYITDNFKLPNEQRKNLDFRKGIIYLAYKDDVEKAKSIFEKIKADFPDSRTKLDIDVTLSAYEHGAYISLKNVKAKIDKTNGNQGNDQQKKEDKNIPDKYELLQNYPNPFNPTTTISYTLPQQSIVEVSIYNIMGNKVRTFTMNTQSAGYHNLQWDGRNSNNQPVSSGTYIYRLRAVSTEDGKVFERSAKMLLLK